MKRSILLSVLLISAILLLPHGAQAQSLVPLDIDTCAPGHNDWDYTVKVVECVENSVKQAVTAMLRDLSSFMTPIVGAMLTIATAILGMRMMGGEQGMRSKMLGF